MSDQPIPVCPWCGAEGNVTDSFGRPDGFDHPTSYIDWECKSNMQWGRKALQSPECKDRVIAQQAAEIARLRSEWIAESIEVRKTLATALRPDAEDALAEFALDTPETLAILAEKEIERLKAGNAELRRRLGRMLSLAYLAASEGYRDRLQPIYDEDQAYLKQSEVQPIGRKTAVYGYCPKCGAPGVSRERRPNGDDVCKRGHKYRSAEAVSQPKLNERK